MRLSISGNVIKKYAVEVSSPRMVECTEGFQQLKARLTVLSVAKEDAKEDAQPESPEQPGLVDNAAELESKEKAARIIAEAESCAQEIRAQVQEELEQLRQEINRNAQDEVYPAAREEGYQAGYQEGFQAGYQAGEEEGKLLSQKADHLFKLAQQVIQEEYAKADGELLHLSVAIAERLVRSSLAVEPQRLMGIIQALTLMPQEREGWRLHVAQDDAQWLEGSQLPCPWVVDELLNQGDCFLECQEGIFDARLQAQLDKLEHILREELERANVEPFDPNS